jgi:hypothetical protein
VEVRSALADLSVEIGGVRREGAQLILSSAPGSSIDTEIRLSAREVVRLLGRVIFSRAGFSFVLLLPWLVWRRDRTSRIQTRSANINKPW